jgi:hypothetical protein
MKTALVCALLALVPFSSLRMVCVTARGLDARIPAGDAADDEVARAAAECARICTRHPAATPPRPPAPAVECLLVADPTCEFLTGAVVAVLPAAPVLPPAHIGSADLTSNAPRYLSPVPARHAPPPRPIA